MIDMSPLSRALDDLEKVQLDLAGIARRTDDARRGELVKLRRLISTQIAAVGKLAEAFFAGAPAEYAEFRRLYSTMQSAVALHQAEWPAVRLNEIDDNYHKSGQTVRAANRAFVIWLRSRLEITAT